MKQTRFAALLAGAITALLAGVGSSSAAAAAPRAHEPTVVGYVYVNDNSAGENTISGFARHEDGTLTPLPGSPFPSGGEGTGKGIGSQGALQRSADGRYLLAVDPGSSQISVLRIGPDGGLTQVSGGVVSSNGQEPVSIAVHQNLVYVANAGEGGSNYTGFILDPDGDGHLLALAGSTVALPGGSTPGDILFNRTGTNLVGVRVGTSLIDSFAVAENGHLEAAPGSPFEAQGPGPFGSEFRPTNPTQLFVSNAHGGEEAATVSAFRADHDGVLSSIGASPFPDHQTAACWIEISHDGRFLFTVNTASNTISRYEIGGSGSLELLGSTALKTPKAGAEDARLDPDGDSLFVVETGAKALEGFAVDGGSLSGLGAPATALPANSAPFGVVVS